MKRILFFLLSLVMAANVNDARAWEYPTSEPGELPGSGTEADPYRISSAQELANFAYRVNNGYTYYQKYVVLKADITLNERLLDEEGNPLTTAKQWRHIGYEERDNSFRGTFDGLNHTSKLRAQRWYVTLSSNNAQNTWKSMTILRRKSSAHQRKRWNLLTK